MAAMKGGALDYVVKSREMYRDLPIIVERALRASRADRDKLRAESSLRESEERFRQLADTIEQAFWLYDVLEQRMIYASPAFPRVYGLDAENACGSEAARLSLAHADDLAKILASEGVPRAQPHEFRVVMNGRTRWVEERTFPIADGGGQPFRIAGLGQEIGRASCRERV